MENTQKNREEKKKEINGNGGGTTKHTIYILWYVKLCYVIYNLGEKG